MMACFLAGMGIVLAAGLASLLLTKFTRLGQAVGSMGAVAGCLVALFPVLRVLATGTHQTVTYPWQVPYGSLAMGLDPLSAFFLLPILGLSAVCACYGAGYLGAGPVKGNGLHWFFYNLLIAGMALVLVARNGMLFLMAWEMMSLASFFLVTLEHEKPGVQAAGWIYLVAMHLGAFCLLVFFMLLSQASGSMDFTRILASGPATAPAGVLFLLAFLGFGVKAGIVPLHVWLPEAHPAAPSHVSALMSGAMIKTGVYGLLRFLGFFNGPEEWWGYLLLITGVASALSGVIMALAQNNLKRLLAYSSVENAGIIMLGLGLGILGMCWQAPALTLLGFGGCLLHVLNHAFFKGALFLSAGSVLHQAGSIEFDQLGGLLKRMPWTGTAFFVGAAAICGLPPLNGFVSEFLIYLGAFQEGLTRPPVAAGLLWLAAAGLAMTGGLAIACFTKAFGMVFLGEPRTPRAQRAQEAGWAMLWPMLALAAGCLAIGLLGPVVMKGLFPVIMQVSGLSPVIAQTELASAAHLLAAISSLSTILILVAGSLLGLRHWLWSRHPREDANTWDCGFAQPTPRMQYSAASFSQPITRLFQSLLRTRRSYQAPKGLFPKQATFHTESQDVFRNFGFQPIFRSIDLILSRLRWIQHGRVQIYVLYIAIALLTLLVWKLR